ncbi:MAG: DMT family transporter [Betaproteobacteria bacterium]|nr:DMT family transporter [Betaproteobacteria bacterium]
MDNARSAHRRGLRLMLIAVLLWSSGGILVRLVNITSGWEIVFWRSLFMAVFVAGTLAFLHRRQLLPQVLAVGRIGLASSVVLAGTFFFFILSITRTTVANTLVIMSMSPFLAAIAGWWFLHEKPPRRTWIAMAVAFGGICLMFAESLELGRLLGNLLALGVSVCFAINVTLLRRADRSVSMLPTVLLAGLWSAGLAVVFAWPLQASAQDIGVLAIMGCFQLGAGCLLMTRAAKDLSASELGLLSLLEPILGPVWVWLGVGERPSDLALTGGAVVIGALVVNEAAGMWQRRG